MQQILIAYFGILFVWFLMVGLFLLLIVGGLVYILGYADFGEDNIE